MMGIWEQRWAELVHRMWKEVWIWALKQQVSQGCEWWLV